jgi:phage terminase large subunit GpA-like protein
MHFPNTSIRERYTSDWCDLDYFQQLATSEHIVRDRKGRTRRWEKVKPDARNEALDLEVYAWAIYTLLNIKPEDMEARLARLEEPLKPEEKPMPSPAEPAIRRSRKKVLNQGRFPRR